MDLSVIQNAFFETGNSLDFVESGFWENFPALKVGPFDPTSLIQPFVQPLFAEAQSSLSQFIQTLENSVNEFNTFYEAELGELETVFQTFGQDFSFVKELIEYDFYLT